MGSVQVWRIGSGDDPALVHRVASAFDPARVEVHHPMLWSLGREVADRFAARLAYTAHVLAAVMDELRELDTPTASAAAEAAAICEADVVHAPSRWVERELLERWPQVAMRLRRRRLGIDVGELPLVRPHGMRRFAVGMVGRFSDVKGTDAGLDVLAALLGGHPEALAVVVGGLPESARSERRVVARFRDRTPEPVAARVTFTGWLPRAEALEVMADTRVMLAPSVVETWGLAVTEAMALGCCVVAAPNGGHDEQIEHLRTGILSVDHDAASLLEDVRPLVRHPDLAEELGMAAHRMMTSRARDEQSS